MWRGVLHHVCGAHEWALGKCQHQPLDAVSSAKDCMLSRSAAYEALSQIVLNRRWLKDVEKFHFGKTLHNIMPPTSIHQPERQSFLSHT